MIMDLIMAASNGSELYRQLQKLEASDAAVDDEFGYSVALSSDGNTCAVGARLDDNSGGSDAGSVYIWTRSGSTWTQQQRLQASDAAANDTFGCSVALSSDGNTCAVGARLDDNSGGSDAGSVYILTRSGGAWTQQQRLQASDAAAVDYFGDQVALSSDGNTCAVGARLDDNSGGSDAGSVYIWTRSGSTWTQQQRLQASDAAANDTFGCSVALSSDGNTCAVGARLDDNSAGSDNGSVYIWTRSGGVWTQQQKLVASDPIANAEVGYSVALSSDGNTCIAGGTDPNFFGADAGRAYIWTRSGSVWSQQQKLTAPNPATNDRFGYSVALSSDGNTCAVGSTNYAAGADLVGGATYIWTRSAGIWTHQQKLVPSDPTSDDRFGYSVALSGDGRLAAVGSSRPSAGATHIFLW